VRWGEWESIVEHDNPKGRGEEKWIHAEVACELGKPDTIEDSSNVESEFRVQDRII